MKKIITSLFILCVICSAASAQTNNSTEFGVNIGFNSSSIEYSQTGEHSTYTGGINLGVSVESYFSDRWSIKGKLIYDQKGWGDGYITLNDGSEIDGVDYHLNYLTVPIMANWHFARARNWYLDFGPYVGFLLSASESSNTIPDVKDAFNATDFGLSLGIGVKIPINRNTKLFFEYEGQGGATNVFKQSDGTYQTIRSSLNIGLNFK